MKRKPISLLAIFLSTSFLFSGCELDTSTDSVSISNAKSETSIATSIEESESSTTPQEILESTEQTTSSATEAVTTTTSATTTTPASTTTEPDVEITEFSDEMKVHFIDVDQGDSTFIELPNGEAMLIDAGETDQADKVVTYIYTQGYDTIDYVVATHAHSDHIGGLPVVLDSFNIGNFYMTSAVATTSIYENMLNAVDESGAAVHDVMAGDVIYNEANLLIEVVAPKEIDYDEQNNNSVVIKLTYGDDKFLFTGDAEKSEEDGIWTNIKCDVLKVGHHGSDSSSSSNFLKKLSRAMQLSVADFIIPTDTQPMMYLSVLMIETLMFTALTCKERLYSLPMAQIFRLMLIHPNILRQLQRQLRHRSRSRTHLLRIAEQLMY